MCVADLCQDMTIITNTAMMPDNWDILASFVIIYEHSVISTVCLKVFVFALSLRAGREVPTEALHCTDLS